MDVRHDRTERQAHANPEPEPEPEPHFKIDGSPGLASDMVSKTKRKAGLLKGMMGRTSEITPFLYVGGSASAEDDATLQKNGITHIINATVRVANFYPNRYVYLRVRAPDVESTDLSRHFDTVVGFVEQSRQSGGKTLIHCSAGMSRSVALALAYLLTYGQQGAMTSTRQGMALIDAFRLVKSKRSIVAPNPSFMTQLAEYEVHLRGGTASIDLIKYSANRFGKTDSYVVEQYKQSAHD